MVNKDQGEHIFPLTLASQIEYSSTLLTLTLLLAKLIHELEKYLSEDLPSWWHMMGTLSKEKRRATFTMLQIPIFFSFQESKRRKR